MDAEKDTQKDPTPAEGATGAVQGATLPNADDLDTINAACRVWAERFVLELGPTLALQRGAAVVMLLATQDGGPTLRRGAVLWTRILTWVVIALARVAAREDVPEERDEALRGLQQAGETARRLT